MWRRSRRQAACPCPCSLLFSCLALLALTEAIGRSPGSRLFGPRMDYDEWTPLGRGDPLKNDPTYDYVPPVLERVHYWVDPKEGNLRRDNSLDPFVKFVESPLPVPPTMLVPPPYQPPPPPPPPPVSSTPPMPAGALSYSSLNPYHHFEDQPVVANIHFEERPGPGPGSSPLFEQSAAPLLLALEKPQLQLQLPAPGPHKQARPVLLFEDKPTSGGKAQPTANTIRFEDKPAVNKVHAAAVNTTAKPAAALVRRPQNSSSATPASDIRFDAPPLRPVITSNAIGGADAPRRPPMAAMPTLPPPPSTSSSLALPPKPTTVSPLRDNAISSFVKDVRHQEATTVSTLTTDPLFSHYKQPASPVNGPPYLIIQGHSKVKTYGPSKPTSIHGIPVHAHNSRRVGAA